MDIFISCRYMQISKRAIYEMNFLINSNSLRNALFKRLNIETVKRFASPETKI